MLLVASLLAACTPPADAPRRRRPSEGSSGHTGLEDTAPPVPTFDCATIPELPLEMALVPSARATKGLAFGEDDTIVGSDGSTLVKATSDGDAWVFSPGVDSAGQMAYLPDGDLVVASKLGPIVRISPQGGQSNLHPTVRAYGVAIGPDGQIYTANEISIDRIDPATGEVVEVLSGDGLSPKVMAFSRDGRTMYFGSRHDGGVFEVDLDEQYLPVGAPRQIATIGGYHDAIALDACGNLYIADYITLGLFRIGVSGTVYTLREPADATWYGHGIVWGTGRGGWDDLSIYQPLPNNDQSVGRVALGVPAASWEGDVAGVSPY